MLDDGNDSQSPAIPQNTGAGESPWKVNRLWETKDHVLYAKPERGRVMIGMMKDAELAQYVCELHNASRAAESAPPEPVTVSYTGPDGNPRQATLPPPFWPLLGAYTEAQGETPRSGPPGTLSAGQLRTLAGPLGGGGGEPPVPPAVNDNGPPPEPAPPPPDDGIYPPRAQQRMANSSIRAWARRNGWPDLGDRGRIPVEALQKYASAHSS